MNYDTARINAFCANEDNFVVVAAGTPEWHAIQADRSRKAAAKRKRVEAASAKDQAVNPFAIGQMVKSNCIPKARGYVEGQVVAITGKNVRVKTATGTAVTQCDRLIAA
jgi:hypothetical protein